MRAYAVIGAGFGDEGKGASVDALVHGLIGDGRRPVVIRASSGAQAAHTVACERDGRRVRHVFGHLGSGTLAGDGPDGGAPTWFGPRYVHHPPLFLREHAALVACRTRPRASGDPRGAVTLPVDVAVNQVLERARGADRHGSCGIGFGEAVGRSERPSDRVTLGDLHGGAGDGSVLAEHIAAISARHAERRIGETGLVGEAAAFVRRAADPGLVGAWLADALRFAAMVPAREAGDLRRDHDAVVFEGAQGLLLDRDHAFFPHVTRSRTGLAGVAGLVPALGIEVLEAIHVTRAYATRHGAGPLPGEGLAGPTGEAIAFPDRTNVPNPYQQALRFAPLVPSLVGGAIAHDLARARATLAGRARIASRLAITCLDQTGGDALVLRDGAVRAVAAGTMPAELGIERHAAPWLAWGETRADRPDTCALGADAPGRGYADAA